MFVYFCAKMIFLWRKHHPLVKGNNTIIKYVLYLHIGKGKEICKDKKEECTMWEASGSCESNKKFMEKNCRMACGFCEGKNIKTGKRFDRK